MLIAELFQPDLGLFIRCGSNPLALLPNPAASVQPNHLQYLRVAGRVMGMALLHGVPLGFHLGKAFYAGLAGSLHNLSELNFLLQCQQEVDPQLHSTLRGILDAPADSVSSMCLTFRITCDRLGEAVEVALGGKPDKAVTAANRGQYVRLALLYLLSQRTAQEVAAFRTGLEDVLQLSPTRMFSCAALNAYIAGAADTGSAEEWRQHTRCVGWPGWRGAGAVGQDSMAVDGGGEEPQALKWFWVLLAHISEAQRLALLRFWTSLPSLPLGGFSALPRRLAIVRADHATQRFPQAHTCFYQLVLPEYPDILSMAAGLHEAIASAEGFGMA